MRVMKRPEKRDGKCMYTEYVKYVYNIVRLDTQDMDAIYGDYVKQMVGVYGLNALIENNLVERCGDVNGRLLYVLRDKKGD